MKASDWKVSDYAEQMSPYCYDHASACAKATIEYIYREYEDKHCLSDIDIDKVKDALQCLMYIKNLESTKH